MCSWYMDPLQHLRHADAYTRGAHLGYSGVQLENFVRQRDIVSDPRFRQGFNQDRAEHIDQRYRFHSPPPSFTPPLAPSPSPSSRAGTTASPAPSVGRSTPSPTPSLTSVYSEEYLGSPPPASPQLQAEHQPPVSPDIFVTDAQGHVWWLSQAVGSFPIQVRIN